MANRSYLLMCLLEQLFYYQYQSINLKKIPSLMLIIRLHVFLLLACVYNFSEQ